MHTGCNLTHPACDPTYASQAALVTGSTTLPLYVHELGWSASRIDLQPCNLVL